MTAANTVLIAALLDRSGSMASIKTDTEGGFDSFIAEQRKQPGHARVTLAQFDTAYQLVYDEVAIDEVEPLILNPRGGTALLDALGRLVTDVGRTLAARNEENRPELVVVVVMTDGHENSSIEWTVEEIRDLITQQQDVYNWKFVFLGANIDAVATAGSYGIPMASSMTFDADSAGAQAVYASTSNMVSSLRAGGPAEFTLEERLAAHKASKASR